MNSLHVKKRKQTNKQADSTSVMTYIYQPRSEFDLLTYYFLRWVMICSWYNSLSNPLSRLVGWSIWRVGNFSILIWKKALGGANWFILNSCDLCILFMHHLQQFKGIQSSKLCMWMGYNKFKFINRRYSKGMPCLSQLAYKRIRGPTSGRGGPAHIKLCWVPLCPHPQDQLDQLCNVYISKLILFSITNANNNHLQCWGWIPCTGCQTIPVVTVTNY